MKKKAIPHITRNLNEIITLLDYFEKVNLDPLIEKYEVDKYVFV